MKFSTGVIAFVALMLVTAWLVYGKVLDPVAFTGPVALFVGWLIRQPIEMRRPKPLPKLQDVTKDLDDEDTLP